ncbi:MAG: type IV pilin protein [Pseudomonadota bacterium]|uniref:type IV pilin protein n=1 Tax=Gallaecimonas pentaromativorans TaxID=584787 RepID=UPI000AC21BAF|nr:type IV pilin protein [Gallaecimonas pentaromativorans]MED5523946.1 type IV pilin protein [Pseudomonadota bacterium]
MSSKAKGFTLMELMIAVVVVGIISAIAYPSYINYLAKSRRAEAQTELMRLASLEEQYRIDHRTYVSDLTKLGASGSTYTVAKGAFTISANGATDSLTLTATASSDQSGKDPDCAVMTVDETGKKAAKNSSNGGSNGCW